MNPLWLIAVAVGMPSLAPIGVRRREAQIGKRIPQHTLEPCLARQRTPALRALSRADYRLRSEQRPTGSPLP
jgi:hypothetical protein